MIYKQRNVAIPLIAKNVARTSGVQQGVAINTAKSLMADGEIVVINSAGTIVDADTSSTLTQKFRIAVKLSDGDIRFSDTIDAKSVKKVTAQRYAAGANQVNYIGYNGTSGAIDVIDNNLYRVILTLRGSTALDASRMTLKHGTCKSDSSATQSEIAAGITKNLIDSFSREASKLKYNTDYIKFERINSGAQLNAMAAGSAATAAVVNGSKYVTLSSDQSTTCPAGSIIRFGTSGAGTAPCYVVKSISASGLIVELDIPYQGVTETVAAASVETVTEGNWGIKMTGAVMPYAAWLMGYDRSAWTIGIEDFGTTTVTNSTVMSLGTGEGKAVNEYESWATLNFGRQYLNAVAVQYPTLFSSTTGTYAIISIQYTDDYTTELGHKSDAYKELMIACAVGTAGNYDTSKHGLSQQLEAYASKYSWDLTRSTGTDGVASTTIANVIASSTGA